MDVPELEKQQSKVVFWMLLSGFWILMLIVIFSMFNTQANDLMSNKMTEHTKDLCLPINSCVTAAISCCPKWISTGRKRFMEQHVYLIIGVGGLGMFGQSVPGILRHWTDNAGR